MIPEQEINQQYIFRLKNKMQKETATWLLGLGKPIGFLTECPFMRVPYTDKITRTKSAGQPHIMLKGGTGIGKTDSGQSLSQTIRAQFSRISCLKFQDSLRISPCFATFLSSLFW